jgi:hypothetical protein
MTADIFRQLKTLAGEDVGSYGAILRDSCGLWLLWIVLSIFLGNFIKCRHFEEDLAWARIRRERTLPRMGIRCLSFAFWICMLIIGCRGGLCGRVLDPPCVVRLSQQPSGGVLMGNSSFSILKSLGRRPIRSFHFFDSAEELNGIYSPFHVAKPQSPYFGRYKGKNILILILESFSAEHVGFLDREFKEKQSDCTPFLDALAQRSLCFDGFANGSISPDGLVSIFSSIPALQGIPYIRSSRGIANHIEGLSSLLARSGYHDSFFYGGKRYSCDFDCYWRKVGLKRYFCEENFPQKITKNIYSGWGIHDLAWLSYAADVLSREPEPFISGIFTLSSHHPFGIPKGFENTFPRGRHPIQELVAYADYALKCFFEKISSEPWYKNTLFVLVADHTSGAVEPYYHGPIGSFSIPILLFDPEGHLPLECAGQLAQQIDLFPTLLHLLGHAEAHVAFGHDLLDEKHPHFAVNFRHEIYQLLGDDYLLQFDGEKSIGFFDRKKDPLAQRNLLSEPQYDALRRSYERCLQAFLQHYSQVLTQDTLTLENWMRAKNSKASGFTI